MMPDREKVINELNDCLENQHIEFMDGVGDIYAVSEETIRNVIALLKEQEAITIKKTKEHGFGVYGGICPKCRNWIQSAHSYCGFCGQAVKWE